MRNDVLVTEDKYFTNKKFYCFIYTMFTTSTLHSMNIQQPVEYLRIVTTLTTVKHCFSTLPLGITDNFTNNSFSLSAIVNITTYAKVGNLTILYSLGYEQGWNCRGLGLNPLILSEKWL